MIPCALILAPLLVFGQEAAPLLSRADALRLAVEGNLAQRGAAEQNTAMEATRQAALGALLPSLGLTSTLSRMGPNFAGDPRSSSAISSTGPDVQWSSSFQASLPIWNLGAWDTWKSQSALADASKEHLRGQRTQLAASTDLAYHDVVRQQSLLAAQREALELSRSRRDIARAHLAIGLSSALESMQAQLAVDADSSALLSQETALDQSRRALNALLGRDTRTEFRVEDTIVIGDPGTLDDLLQEARVQSSGLSEAQARARAQAAQALSAAATAISPTVSAYATYVFYNRYHDQNPPADAHLQGFVYGLQATWSIFSGGSQTAQWRAAQAQARAADLARADSALQLERAVVQGWDAWKRSQASLQIGERGVSLADSTLSMSLAQYKAGTLSGIDLRQSQEAVLAARGRRIAARWNARAIVLQLLGLAGLEPK